MIHRCIGSWPKTLLLVLVLIGQLFVASYSVEALPFGSVGARAMGMGNAFTAVSDDLTCVHWNPAGLGFLSTIQLSMPYDRFLDDRDDTRDSLENFREFIFSASFPEFIASQKNRTMSISGNSSVGFLFGMPGFGLSLIERDFASITPFWTLRDSRADDDLRATNASSLKFSGLETSQYAFSFCYGEQSAGYFLGLSARYVEYRTFRRELPITDLDKFTVEDLYDKAFSGDRQTGSYWTGDLGLMLFMSGWRIGLTVRDVLSPEIEFVDDSTEKFEPQYRCGIVMPLSGGINAAVDYDISKNRLFDSDQEEQQLAAGLEMSFAGELFKLRAGGHKNLAVTGSLFHYSLGAGLTISIFTIETAASISQDNSLWNWAGMVTMAF